jgi:small subunit ribosomal protein S25e
MIFENCYRRVIFIRGPDCSQLLVWGRDVSERAGKEFTAFVPENLMKRIKREIVREKFVTPYMLAEKYNMTMSLAKKVLRRLEQEGIVELYARSRRAPIYVIKASK